MQFLGRIIGTVSNVFTNPYRVREVQLSEYKNKVKMKQDGRTLLYRDTSSQAWDCVLMMPDSPMALRLFQVTLEEDAANWFSQYALKLRPFYETLRPPLKPETLQQIVDCVRNHPDWSSAHIAVDTGLRDCLKHNHVLSQMNVRDAQGQTPLHLACERGGASCVRELIEECQARTDIRDKNGDTPMHCAAKQDSAVIVEVLCSQLCPGVNDLNLAGETPLHLACRMGKAETAKALMGGGARTNIIGGSGYPIHTAMKYSSRSCAKVILADDLNQLQAEDPVYGGTPLHWVKTAEMSRLLLDHGCSVNYLSKTGDSPLHILCKRGRYEAAMTLLTHGANPNMKGENGNTALHLAMKLDNIELIKALIVFGADMEIHNDLGETPGLIAARTSKGFNDLVHAAAAISAISRGYTEVDGLRTNKKVDRLLCLDGGGIKGLVLIQILIALEKEAGRPIRELFDWVAGTSTGGILALAVVHGKSMDYLRRLYFRMKDEVFKGSRPYESAPLEDFLKQEFGEDTKMTDVRHPKVMVTSVLADRHPGELHIFRNYDAPSIPRDPPYASTATFRPLTTPQGWEDEDVLIVGYTQEPVRKRRNVTDEEQAVWRAARSSGAAPTYFRPMGRFLDGGLLANNPTLDAMTEIHQYNKSLKAQGRGDEVSRLSVVVSLGTGKPPQVAVNSVDVFRPSNPLELAKSFVGVKELGKMLVDCCTDSDGCAVDRARAWCEMADINYQRLSPQLSSEVLLDEVSDSVLVNMLWETQMYLYENRELIQSLAQQLLQP
ncbi:85/88 kDa calcium-independent phospholipase A2 isoform X3 [Hemibagrus wyckioides]|uniref:85/88 kDa calcium-independent phospholipase A2 isoform X3 n=1 Tax=Hemibagrus wyckioides TaxID=337641 RepID=UPI00266BF1A1|nr:85/88 kDa calcium-independent phospholipase A2 isoform X3 [Hemibagrus wyckioides]